MKRHFTLVEVLIAMGVCVVGVCSIMALFPVGIANSRDASMAGMASSTADQILHLTKACIVNESIGSAKTEGNFQELTGFTNIDDTSTYGTQSKPGESAEPTNEDGWVDVPATAALGNLISDLLTNDDTTVKVSSTNSNVYKITKGEYEDFDCIARLWAEPIEIELTTSSNTKLPRAARFHIEISWPAQKSYAKRQTAEYTLDVYCPPRKD